MKSRKNTMKLTSNHNIYTISTVDDCMNICYTTSNINSSKQKNQDGELQQCRFEFNEKTEKYNKRHNLPTTSIVTKHNIEPTKENRKQSSKIPVSRNYQDLSIGKTNIAKTRNIDNTTNIQTYYSKTILKSSNEPKEYKKRNQSKNNACNKEIEENEFNKKQQKTTYSKFGSMIDDTRKSFTNSHNKKNMSSSKATRTLKRIKTSKSPQRNSPNELQIIENATHFKITLKRCPKGEDDEKIEDENNSLKYQSRQKVIQKIKHLDSKQIKADYFKISTDEKLSNLNEKMRCDIDESQEKLLELSIIQGKGLKFIKKYKINNESVSKNKGMKNFINNY